MLVEVGIEAFGLAEAFADLQVVDNHALRQRVLHPIFWLRVRVQKISTDSAAFGSVLYAVFEHSVIWQASLVQGRTRSSPSRCSRSS